MSNMTIKQLSSMMSKNAASAVAAVGQQNGAVSFESVWNNQTEKNNSSEIEMSKNAKKNDSSVRDSLKAKDAGKATVKEKDDVHAKKPEDMSPEELENAMEVLGTTAVEVIQQIAEAFDMTVEEVQSLMADLGMEQLDVLQQEHLGALLLAAAGVEDSMALLTDGELYQKYQMLMEQMNAMLEQCSEDLQMSMEDMGELLDGDNLPIEITVEEEISVVDKQNVAEDGQDSFDNMNSVTEVQNGGQMQKQNDSMNSEQNADDKGQNGNLMLQNLKNLNMDAQVQQLSATTSTWDADTMDIMKQIMDYMRIQIKPDVSNLEMQLHPENLGTLQIHLASKGGTVTAQFVTQNDAVKAVLESQMIQLKESFAEQGVKVDAVEVTVQTHQFEQNLEQGRGRQSEETEKRQKTRRIRLDGELTMEALDNMEEEEQLAAQMMAANGTTVDYTA